jgi:transposase
MKWKYFIGMDVSKATLDVAVVVEREVVYQQQISNSLSALRQLLKTLKKEVGGFELCQAVFCMEHTGIYNYHSLRFLHRVGGQVSLQSAVHMKWSLGLQRGKNDRVDAQRIARYAYKSREEIKLWEAKREVVEKLSHLTALRERLIHAKNQLEVAYRETAEFHESAGAMLKSLSNASVKAIARDLEQTEKAIDELIMQDEELKRLFKIITSVQGVGKVTAAAMIVSTNEYKDISEAKQYAYYAGVAPFEHSSGSIKGKSRVSDKANKQVKSLLHMAALCAITYNEDLKKYYERKLKEKNNKMLIINAVRNKLIHRIFACVKQNRLYEKNYHQTLV